MSLHKTCLIASSLYIFSAAVSPANAGVIEVYPATNKQGQTTYELPTIVVRGSGRGQYGSLETRELTAWLTIRGEAPNRAERHLGAWVEIAGTSIPLDKPGSTKTSQYIFEYKAPDSVSGASQLSPIELCNEEAEKGNKNAREKFIVNGGSIILHNAYQVEASSSWITRKRGSIFDQPNPPWTSKIRIRAIVKCLPTGNFAKTSQNTSTSSAQDSGAMRDALNKKNRDRQNDSGPSRTNPQPSSSRTNPEPTVKTVAITIAPASVQRVGNWMCPTILRLKGRVDVRRSFKGNSIFTGPQWLSQKTELNFQGAKGRYVLASYPLKWSVGGLSSGAGSAPSKEVKLSFNVADVDGKLVDSDSKTIQVACKKP